MDESREDPILFLQRLTKELEFARMVSNECHPWREITESSEDTFRKILAHYVATVCKYCKGNGVGWYKDDKCPECKGSGRVAC